MDVFPIEYILRNVASHLLNYRRCATGARRRPPRARARARNDDKEKSLSTSGAIVLDVRWIRARASCGVRSAMGCAKIYVHCAQQNSLPHWRNGAQRLDVAPWLSSSSSCALRKVSITCVRQFSMRFSCLGWRHRSKRKHVHVHFDVVSLVLATTGCGECVCVCVSIERSHTHSHTHTQRL